MGGPPASKRSKLSVTAYATNTNTNVVQLIPTNGSTDCNNNSSLKRKQRFPRKLPIPVPIEVLSPAGKTNCGSWGKLSQNVLSIIFGYTCFKVNDLLTLRLVNHHWLNSVTDTILERNLCQLQFTTKEVPLPSTKDPNAVIQIYCNARQTNAILPELNDLITKSTRFPSASLRFTNEFAFGSDIETIQMEELEKFFTLYGCKLKGLCLGNKISMKELHDLLLYKVCNLEYIDLNNLTVYRRAWSSHKKHLTLPIDAPILATLKTIRLGSCLLYNCYHLNRYAWKKVTYSPPLKNIDDRANLCSLIMAAWNVKEFKDVSITNLSCLLELGKGHLVKDLDLNPPKNCTAGIFLRLLEFQPKLTQLKINLDICNIKLIYPDFNEFPKMSVILSYLFQCSQYSLEELELHVNPYDFPKNIKIPPLENLKRIKFTESTRNFNLMDEGEEEDIFVLVNPAEDHSQGSHFPRLNKVELDVTSYQVEDKLMGFFFFGYGNDEDGDFEESGVDKMYSVCTVETLEIHGHTWPNHEEIPMLKKLFPSVKYLTIRCEHVRDLHCSLWTLCPMAEKVEIYGLSNGGNVDDCFSFVDSFFTGFSPILCRSLECANQVALKFNEKNKFIRTNPSICTLKNLKEFKMNISNLMQPFASFMTTQFALQTMTQTKFQFSCDEINSTTTKFMEPLLPYVELICSKKEHKPC